MKTPRKCSRTRRICFVAHNAYGTISRGETGHIGGIEWQQSLMARWFASRGYRVSMLTSCEDKAEDEEIDRLRVIKMCKQNAGVPLIRFFHPRWTSLVRALQRADADTYYHNCGEYVTGQVAIWCRRNGRRFVYSVASDPDCDPQLPQMKTYRERILYRYGLRHADRVIVQTRRQQEMLRVGFGVESRRISMPCPGPRNGEYVPPAPPNPLSARVGWVGRIAPVKRLEVLLDLAEALPDVRFDVAGIPAVADAYARGLQSRAITLPNVVLHGRVGREQMPAFYESLSCLCCTSLHEGFPNTFIEAWSHGLPIVSTFDPDDLIAKRAIGAVADDVPGLVSAIRGLLKSPQRWREVSENARRYYLENHAVDKVMPQFERVFLDIVAQHTDSHR